MTKIIAFKGYRYPGDRLPAAELLRLYRTRSQLTQAELAQHIGLRSDRVIRKWEKGQSLPEASRLKKLIEFYITEKLFTWSQEEAEASTLWEAVKETFELESQTFETYNIFDKSWFAGLINKLYLNPVAELSTGSQTAENAIALPSSAPNFPASRDSFIGREKEIAQLRDILATTRLLTVTGPPGVGKTRLALELCSLLYPPLKDGLFLVKLEFLTNSEYLPQAISQVLGISGEALGLPTLLFNFLQDKEILLVLDLFDSFVVGGSHFIDQLLTRCRKVKVLITSRETLGISGETIFQLDPLDVLDNQAPPTHSEQPLTEFPAGVRLFAERAIAAQSDFELNTKNAAIIARICQQLDGLPLAIELAASLVEVLEVAQIEARLNQPFELFKRTFSNNTQPDHLKSLTKNFELSFSRLNEEERLCLKRLCKLTGWFNLETAEQLLVEDSGLPKKRFLKVLESLVRKSLVRSHNQNEIVTFSILKMVRSYCLYLEKEGN
jgi:predicted ATPase/transcriptional regulator with XRE-family HTH domain